MKVKMNGCGACYCEFNTCGKCSLDFIILGERGECLLNTPDPTKVKRQREIEKEITDEPEEEASLNRIGFQEKII